MDNRLRFYARGSALVTDPHAQERGIRRFIGRRWQEVLPGRWAWCPTGEAQAIEAHPDLVKAARDGDLWPADEATAKACGLPFSTAFDDETTETIKAFRERKAAAEAASKAPLTTESTKKADKPAGKGDV